MEYNETSHFLSGGIKRMEYQPMSIMGRKSMDRHTGELHLRDQVGIAAILNWLVMPVL